MHLCMCACVRVSTCVRVFVCTIIRALLPVSHKAAAAQAHRLEACSTLDALSEWLEGWMNEWMVVRGWKLTGH